jgi:Protein of unknown function (DUF3176)
VLDVKHAIDMADQYWGGGPGIAIQHTIPRKSLPPPRTSLPVLPRHARLRAWIQRRVRRLVHGWWAWELIAAAVSVAATVALDALLASADQHLQETWTVGSTQLTLNTLVAIIATIIRASLLLVVAGALNQRYVYRGGGWITL